MLTWMMVQEWKVKLRRFEWWSSRETNMIDITDIEKIDAEMMVDAEMDPGTEMWTDWSKILLREGQNPPIERTWYEVKNLTKKRSRNGSIKYKPKLINPTMVLTDERSVPPWVDEPTEVVEVEIDRKLEVSDQNGGGKNSSDVNSDQDLNLEKKLEAGRAKISEMMRNGGRITRKARRPKQRQKMEKKTTDPLTKQGTQYRNIFLIV